MDSPSTKRLNSRKISSTSVNSTSSSSSDKDEFVYNCPKDVSEILQNHEQLLAVFERIKAEEFPELLYRLFEAHEKTKELFECAIQKDLSSIDSPDKFQLVSTSVLYQLLLILIHNDFGRKFMQLALSPLIKRCVSFVRSENSNETEEEFVRQTTEEFLDDLGKNTERCPIAFQEALIMLKESLQSKFPTISEYCLPSIMFSTYLCDIVEQPFNYLEKSKDIDVNEIESCNRLFKQVSNLLRDKTFIETSPLPLSVFNKLSDRNTVSHFKEVIDSNRIVNADKLRFEAESRMHRFLKGGSYNKSIQEHLLYEKAKRRITKILADQEGWTKLKGSKRYGIVGFGKIYEWSPVIVCKAETVFKVPLSRIKRQLSDHIANAKLDKRVEIIKEVRSNHNVENRKDYYVRTIPSFPVAGRDLIIAKYDEWNEKDALIVAVSVEHEDYPKFPKVVRAQIIVTAALMKENEAGTEVAYTLVSQTDPAGSVPLWMVNKWNTGYIDEMKRLHKEFAKSQ